ncbi:MAG: class A beta-lactamase-related serine hydrolase [Candidatus Thermochlorobacter aerophilum]|jgi:CubicO group peptidase (beta-lactamase class C family)|uniref:Class A beta-lactamase-related serine hydrolase n=1 Tax=Candidatus Thermochlorobacter aerophilus TaxID=1868324 RepID=A0A395M2H9_9BACT|nr:MAG: class A beta-lactamase-related serine hydrolase [Candidatus Thermochlorobacter aerophilum]
MRKLCMNAVLLAMVAIADWQSNGMPTEQGSRTLSHALDSIAEAHSIVGLSVAIVCPDSLLFSYSRGQAQLGRAIAMTETTYVRIASVSKVLTAVALLQLHEKGKFKLDDDVSKALGFTFRNPYFPDVPITYRQLLQHTSSLLSDEQQPVPYYVLWRDPTLALQDVLSKNGKRYQDSIYYSLWAKEAPGKKFAYSNLGYALLGTLVEIHSGERFDQYCNTHIFKPLGFACSFNLQDIPPEKVAYPYRLIDGKWTAQVDSVRTLFPLDNYAVGSNALLFSPQGGLRISARELATLAQVFLNGGKLRETRILSESQLLQMEKDSLKTGNPFIAKYAMGLHHTSNVLTGIEMTGHLGQAYGLLSGWYYTRQHGIGIAVIITGGLYKETGEEFYDVERKIYAAIQAYLQATQQLSSR